MFIIYLEGNKSSIMKRILPIFFCFLLPVILKAQGIKGTIKDHAGKPIAYADIYVPQLKTGTTSNVQGQFKLSLPDGTWKVLFQYIGYQTVAKKFLIENKTQTIHVILEPQNVQLTEVKILASGEDPAYYVMRHAIAMAPYYRNQVAEYSCNLYLKGTGVVYKIPGLFKRRVEKAGIKKNQPFVMESLNKIHFQLPDKLNQQVIAMHSTGDDRNTNPMRMITTNLYNVEKYGVASPVGSNAMKFYRFKLVGEFKDQGKLIDKIQVIPKVKGSGTFSGILNIVDGYWNIYSADLKFSMPMTQVTMRQLYGLVASNTWMPTSLNFEMNVSALGFGVKYNYVASLSNYKVKLNKKLDPVFLRLISKQEKEKAAIDSLTQPSSSIRIMRSSSKPDKKKMAQLMNKQNLTNHEMHKLGRMINKETKRTRSKEPLEIPQVVKASRKSIKNDSTYWAKLRPVPLTGAEMTQFGKKDSIVKAHSTPEYRDSIHDVREKFKFKDIILGRTYKYGNDSSGFHSEFSEPGIIHPLGLSFNTVDGFKYSLPFWYDLTDTLGHRFHANASVSYAFSRKALYAEVGANYRYNGIKQRWVSFSAGHVLEDFKGDKGITPRENTIYTTLFEDNFQKFYDKKFVSAQWGTEIINGLLLKAGFQWAKRSPVINHSGFKIIDVKNREYTPNIPNIAGIQSWQLEESIAAIGTLQLSYTPRQHYRIRHHVKYPAYSKFPTFTLWYEKGFKNLLGSGVDYDLLKFGINQNVKIGFDDHLYYSLVAGKYLNAQKLYAQDYTFFNSNNQVVRFSNPFEQFGLAKYYQLFSYKHFVEGNVNLDFGKLLLKRLPLLNKTLIRENLKISYMKSESVSNYAEISYGLHNIFLLFDVDFYMGFQDWEHRQTGVSISINLH